MKKKILLGVFILTMALFSNQTFAQRDAGGSAGGVVTTLPDLSIDLGSAGVVEIPATSAYYSFVTSLLTYFHATITNGVVTFPTATCYTGSVGCLYMTGCINRTTYQSACRSIPAGCH